MDVDEYRRRARACRIYASRAGDALRAYFLATAETWDSLADQRSRIWRITPEDLARERKAEPLKPKEGGTERG